MIVLIALWIKNGGKSNLNNTDGH